MTFILKMTVAVLLMLLPDLSLCNGYQWRYGDSLTTAKKVAADYLAVGNYWETYMRNAVKAVQLYLGPDEFRFTFKEGRKAPNPSWEYGPDEYLLEKKVQRKGPGGAVEVSYQKVAHWQWRRGIAYSRARGDYQQQRSIYDQSIVYSDNPKIDAWVGPDDSPNSRAQIVIYAILDHLQNGANVDRNSIPDFRNCEGLNHLTVR